MNKIYHTSAEIKTKLQQKKPSRFRVIFGPMSSKQAQFFAMFFPKDRPVHFYFIYLFINLFKVDNDKKDTLYKNTYKIA